MNTAFTVEDWRLRARRRLPRFAFDYLEGGAGDECALARNREAFSQMQLVPDRLENLANCGTQTELFGKRIASPLVVAPIGLNGLFWPNGDLALMKAAARAGIPFTLSTASTSSIEAVMAAAKGEKWFQLYVLEDRRIAEGLLARARLAGFHVLVLTVDMPVNANRLRDLRNGFEPPFRYSSRLVFDALRHPAWLRRIMRSGLPRLINVEGSSADEKARESLLKRQMDRTLTWDSLSWIKAHWPGPVVLKGIMSARDAIRALESGIDGVVVSNHGGRQLDASPASIEMLGEVTSALAKRLTVLVDGGFRQGSDVLKALALGANAVLIGRPVLYGLSSAGEAGAFAVLDLLKADVERSLLLMGAPNIRRLESRHVRCSCLVAQHASLCKIE